MKILGVRWFTNREGTTGIARIETDYDGIKYFISHVDGFDESIDSRYVADWGSTFDYSAGNTLFGVKE